MKNFFEFKSNLTESAVVDFYKQSPDIAFRLTNRGSQDYIQPKVGKTWADSDRQKIKEWLKAGGFNVTFISNGKLSVTNIGGEVSIQDLKLFSHKYS